MKTGLKLIVLALLLAGGRPAAAQEPVQFGAPGFPLSQMDGRGRLVEDWGAMRLSLTGEGLPASPPGAPAEAKVAVEEAMLDGIIPAARAQSQYGPLALTLTAFRGPAWPKGVDVLLAEVRETAGRPAKATLLVDAGEKPEVRTATIAVGSRVVVALPESPSPARPQREWGHNDDSTALPGWAHPQGDCDPAFRNIRAGMGGVPICYRFPIEKKGALQVVLGFCESHWSAARQRPLLCVVEGAERQDVDPIAKWGRHKPGALLFDARDENGDGWLDVSVLPHPDASDRNPILNVIWLFPAGRPLKLDQVVAGRMNAAALRCVDVGGRNDQSLYVPGKLEYQLSLPPNGAQKIAFMVACRDGAAPTPDRSAWTPDSLQAAASAVWRDWFAQGAPLVPTAPRALDAYRRALAHIILYRHQADGFFLPLSKPAGPQAFDARALEELTWALDLAGFHAEAERSLRVLWDSPLPKAYAALAQGKDGHWPGDVPSQARLLLALARHGTTAGTPDWAQRVLPAVKAGAEWLAAARPTGQEAVLASQALSACAALAQKCSGAASKEASSARELASWCSKQAKMLCPTPPPVMQLDPVTPEAKALQAELVHK